MSKKRITNVFWAIVFTMGLGVMSSSPAIANENAPLNLAGCDANILPAGNDAFASASLGFPINVGDSTANEDAILVNDIFISENGIVSFDNPIDSWFGGLNLTDVVDRFGDAEVIAPLYVDADRSEGGSVTWGQTTYLGKEAFCIKWNDLTPSVSQLGLSQGTVNEVIPKNSFELVIVSRADRAAGDVDVIVNYESIQWDGVSCNQELIGDDDDFTLNIVNLEDESINTIPSDTPLDAGGECNHSPDLIVVDDDDFGETEQVTLPISSAPAALAGLAFTNGFDSASINFPGSGQLLAMVDDNGLASKSLNSLQAGRFIVEIENGLKDNELGIISGVVVDIDFNPVEGSIVEACTTAIEPKCALTRTDIFGEYQLGGAAIGEYRVTAYGPEDSSLMASSVSVEVESAFGITESAFITLKQSVAPPQNVDFGPVYDWGEGTVVYSGAPLDLSVTACIGGTVTWFINAEKGLPVTGVLSETSEATYTGVIPPLNPLRGLGVVNITVSCPDSAENQNIEFDLYIDPSGTVTEVHSGEPISGATVVLSRSDQETGPFVNVPNGSDIMSPSNRQNPFIVGENGQFGWDTVTGYYIVTATAPGCHLVNDESISSVQTDILPVQPEWLGLSLKLDCNNPPEWVNPSSSLVLDAPANIADLIAPGDTVDLDPTDIVTISNDAPESLAIGQTTVNWTVTDPDGASSTVAQLVTVVDRIAPVITAPEDIVVTTDNPEGVAVFFDNPTVTDNIDANPFSLCIKAPAFGDLIAVPVMSGDVFPVGTSVISCLASDAAGNESSDIFTITVILQVDNIPPVITVPADITVDADSAEGTQVEFAVSANDDIDGDIAVTCNPASGSQFAASSSTVVNCSAVDAAGNESSSSFTVVVGEFVVTSSGVRDTINNIIAQLGQVQGLSRRDQGRVNRSIRRLSIIDNDRYWLDDNNLSDRRGSRVINRLSNVIASLSRVQNETVNDLRGELLNAMITLTQNRIAKAEADGGRFWVIAAAKWRVNIGLFLAQRGNTSSAARYIQSAWQTARRAS